MRYAFFRSFVALSLAVLLFGCAQTSERHGDSTSVPKNIIILYGDGAAVTQWELGRYTSHAMRKRPFVTTDVVFKEGVMGLATTHSADSLVTDSAAAATALSTGHKTNNGMTGVTPDGKPAQTLMQAARARGKKIGLVSTAEIHDASPAAFSTHARSRRDTQSIVDQFLALEPDVLMGGGRDYFIPKGQPGGRRDDGKDMLAAFAAKGYEVVRDSAGLRAASGERLLALFDDEAMDFEIDRDPKKEPSTADMTTAALRVLSTNNPNGFVLFVENENIDSAGHRNDAAALIRDLWALDDAVQVALDFQRRAPNETLIVVMGDHETGGLSLTYALKDLSSLSTANRFYPTQSQLDLIGSIKISLGKASELLGRNPTPELLDKVLNEHFPKFTLDADLRTMLLKGQPLERNLYYRAHVNILARMISRQTGLYWGTSGHTPEPVVVGALGPGAQNFRGYMDNTDVGKALHKLVNEH